MDNASATEQELKLRRRVLIATSVVGGTSLILTALPFLDSMEPSDKAKAEVDISALQPGQLQTVVWSSKPVWVLRRNSQMLQSLKIDTDLLSDPNSNRSEQPVSCRNPGRSIHPEFAVIIGVCTHLGCTPIMQNSQAAATGEYNERSSRAETG